MGAIVFQEMRESRSLAYMAFTEWINPSYLDDNYLFAAIIATQNDKMAQAIDAFDEIINNMPESEAAFKLAKEAVLTICEPRVRSRTKCSGNTSPTKIWA